MRPPAHWWFLLIAVCCCASPASGQAPPASRLDQLGWLTGAWAWDSAGARVEEHWMAPNGGLMVGMNRTVRDGRARAFEFLRIRERADTVAYLSMPGGRAVTVFPLKELGERRVVFENPTHDFPQRVLYWLADDGRLHARIEGTMNGRPESQNWVWTRAANRSESPPAKLHE